MPKLKRKDVEIVGYNRRKAKTLGYMIWVVLIIIGIIGAIYWDWYMLIISLIAGFVFGSVFSIFQTKRIEKITGFGPNLQQAAYSASLDAKLDPIIKNPKAYKEYINSIPDDEEIEVSFS